MLLAYWYNHRGIDSIEKTGCWPTDIKTETQIFAQPVANTLYETAIKQTGNV